MNRRLLTLIIASSIAVLSGCTSMTTSVQSNDDLVTATAQNLGLAENQITISNRRDEGSAVNYDVKTKAGKQYKCQRFVVISIMGATKSSPLCDQMQNGQAVGHSDNALLKAAGK
jgi:hypothetical protein